MKITNFERRVRRVRGRIKAAGKPRLTVHRTNTTIYAQVIDAAGEKTVAAVNSHQIEQKGMTKTRAAQAVGEAIAKAALAKKVSAVVFDRGGYKYHGRVKALAEAARKGGLIF